MQESQQNKQSDFMIEKIKERPVNKRKLLRKTLITAAMAVIFGLIACFTFLVLEPVINNWLYPEEDPQIIVFPENQEEMSPEEMLAENMEQLNQQKSPQQSASPDKNDMPLDAEQIDMILDRVVFDVENYRQMYGSLHTYVQELNQYMVTVSGISSNVDWFHNVQESKNQSSGVIIANNGIELLVLADYAPLEKAERLVLTFYNGTQADAVVKERDGYTRLAVLAVDLAALDPEFLKSHVKIASLGASNIRNAEGVPVIALGRPMGTTGSLGYGMITSVTANLADADVNYKLMQTDITGSANAGGVLFNLRGQVIGVITNDHGGSDMENMITAYGISELKKRVEKMSNGEKTAYFGISGVDVPENVNHELNVPYGAYITNIDMNSPAMMAGVQKGDILVRLGDWIVSSYGDYISALLNTKAGEAVEVVVLRQAQDEYKEMKFQVVLGEAK